MGFPKYVRRQGIIEYLLLIVIVVLVITIVIKLFGPAINNFIQNLLENV